MLRKVFRSSFPISIRLGSRFAAKLQLVSHGLRIENYELGSITDYELRITNDGLRIKNYEC